MKVILNKCYGGFGVSKEAYELYAKKKGVTLYWYERDLNNRGYKKLYRNDFEDVLFKNAITKDFGDVVLKPDDDFWGSILTLNCDSRTDPTLIEIVEELGSERASDSYSELVVVDIPDDLDYVIDDYDGIETLHQKVQIW